MGKSSHKGDLEASKNAPHSHTQTFWPQHLLQKKHTTKLKETPEGQETTPSGIGNQKTKRSKEKQTKTYRNRSTYRTTLKFGHRDCKSPQQPQHTIQQHQQLSPSYNNNLVKTRTSDT